ncbi:MULTISPECIES: hypothetical protein [unclassified Streptomyces]|uniref:hypothetical protein n=1 Tax=unclassified Streptomyces TaxID=2593676 RepID=UPI001CC1481B|nr:MULTISPECIES: hypothetical protein [unclassified Streptomyces]WPO69657.1 hypothetical protein R9806_02905 [Streptomyces sp. KN37]
MAGQELPGDRARMARLLGSDQQKKNLPVLERIRARLQRIAEEAGHPVPAADDLLRAAEPDQALADITWARTPC